MHSHPAISSTMTMEPRDYYDTPEPDPEPPDDELAREEQRERDFWRQADYEYERESDR